MLPWSLAFEAFLVSYLLLILFLAIYAARAWRTIEQQEREEKQAATQGGLSPSDLIMMRQKMRELERLQD